ncbi:isoprenylcysteine carboxylmethyltransferase family protein [Roseiterribacter gracilis]|uniref:Isoprenylcysteine carboxyl methyltransferase n=1 Tax=Roseiterribacter gracilis TaxID=2812848 RepID=A0A8S8X5S1_9PROT|nr:isoprenylcysteine carboxyl methyltransferase [Rhodospirillales bacterium TMPK1]
MSHLLVLFAIAAILLRIAMLAVSIRHERALRQNGAVEVGAANTTVLALTHVAFYLAAIAEGALRSAPLDLVSWAGIGLYAFGMMMLLIVVRLLGKFWTVKLILARDHALVTHPLFRRVRHPNYFLNILPELVGFALAFHAFVTLIVGLALYAVPLTIRIRQEEDAMRTRFDAY